MKYVNAKMYPMTRKKLENQIYNDLHAIVIFIVFKKLSDYRKRSLKEEAFKHFVFKALKLLTLLV